MNDSLLADANDTLHLGELPLYKSAAKYRISNANPLTQRLFDIALDDINRNWVTDDGVSYFGAGKSFGSMLYTRDIALSGVLGLNLLYPESVLASLKKTRSIRRSLMFKIPSEEQSMTSVLEAPFEVLKVSSSDYKTAYKTNSILRRTDDVVWLWCAGDLAEKYPELNVNQWIYEEGNFFFDNIYKYFYDAQDRLYRGQSCFVDVGSGYPKEWNEWPMAAECIMLKASSTNALYYKGMLVMAGACRGLGKIDEASSWEMRAADLKAAFLNTFLRQDGTIDYYKDRRGHMADRQHVLSTAFPVLFGMIEKESLKRVFANYPVFSTGLPLIWPFFDDGKFYHNNSSWPFADTFFLMAKEKALGVNLTSLNAFILARTCGQGYSKKAENPWGDYELIKKEVDYSFKELTHFASKKPVGSFHTLWTASAYVNVCNRANLLVPQ